ncbi:MAG: potassium transporter TrkA [Gammaproteobacteria bacterium HGW-Gammaproteobacteria-3]|nr:MAG: potassium transporter TrkA [Gammaproteobacteria bacterium HGW-Gammaproteobacteria-3]
MQRIAVFGDNSFSLEAVSRLDLQRFDVLLVETDPARAEQASAQGYKTRAIDFRNDEALKSVGIGRDVTILFCFYSQDCDNVFLTISARALDKNLKIIAIVENPESAPKLLAAGADKIIDPYQICARKIHELVKKPDLAHLLEQTVFGRSDLNMAEITLPKGTNLENTQVSELKLSERYNLILIGIVNQTMGTELHFALDEKAHELNAGDVLVVLGPAREIKSFKKEVDDVGTD